MTISLANKIAEGGCSEVFDIGNNKIIKLAKENTSFEDSKKEFLNNSLAYKLGLPVPAPYEIIEHNGKMGLIVEHVKGDTIMQRLVEHNLVNDEFSFEDTLLTAQLLSKVHSSKPVTGFPSQRNNIIGQIKYVNYLTDAEKDAVVALLDKLPEKQQLCHGDPNPNNMIVKHDGSAVIIDWMNATIGNPEADIAEFIIMFRYAVLPEYFPAQLVTKIDHVREEVIHHFLNEYERLTGITKEEIEPWIIPSAARKLTADGIPEEEKLKLIDVIRSYLK